jgi:hypothetical protein
VSVACPACGSEEFVLMRPEALGDSEFEVLCSDCGNATAQVIAKALDARLQREDGATLTENGIDLSDSHLDLVGDYLDEDGEPVVETIETVAETGEIVVLRDSSGHQLNEWADALGVDRAELSEKMHALARQHYGRQEATGAGDPWSVSDPLVFLKGEEAE